MIAFRLGCGTLGFAIAALCLAGLADPGAVGGAGAANPWVSRADASPRKIVVGTALFDFSGSLEERVSLLEHAVDQGAAQALSSTTKRGLDLVIFPEFAIGRGASPIAAERAVTLQDGVGERIGRKAAQHHTWLVVPMTLREPERQNKIFNAAVLFDRMGNVAGAFRKVHPVEEQPGVWEGGVTQGDAYPVFQCDFGRLGILICWDMSYDEAWASLARGGAEIVALPSASPQTLRPAAAALRHHYYVANSAPRDNASIFDPIGRTAAQITQPGVLVREIDLAYAILHWSENLREGEALKQRFGDGVGFEYSTREDTGVFWSNDPQRSIGSMVRELGLREMPELIEQMARRVP